MSAETYLETAGEQDCVLALENVGNPHNLGGIMRSCAHFGVNGVILQDASVLESGAAVRTAEGGAEHLVGIDADGLTDTLDLFRKRVRHRHHLQPQRQHRSGESHTACKNGTGSG